MSFEYGRYGNPTTIVLEEKIRLLYRLFFLFFFSLEEYVLDGFGFV